MKKSQNRQPSGATKLRHVPDAAASPDSPGGEPGRPESLSRLTLRLVGLAAVVLVPCLVVAIVLCQGPEATRLWWLDESGPVELASGGAYVLLAVGLVAVGAMRYGKARLDGDRATPESIWYPIVLGSCVTALAAREFDWHNIWTTRCALKTRFYIDPAISIEEKLVVLAVLTLIGFLIGTAIRAYYHTFINQLRRHRPAAWLAATGIALLPFSKALDSGPSIFKDLFMEVPPDSQRFLGSFEEIAELAIPALLLLAAIGGFWPRRDGGMATPDANRRAAVFRPRRAA